jgi:NAD dependent epimerase/dehydratase
MYKGKKVFVTGAAGFIGSHLVEELVKNGATVTALVHYNANSSIGNLQYLNSEILNQVNIEFGDIVDAFQMQTLTKEIDIIFHLAALIGIPYSYIAPSAYVSVNINGTLNMLEAGRRNNVERIVVTSTSETYGTAIYAPIDEKHPLQGQSPYSATKIGADKIAESYYLSFDLPVVIFRPFNTYGPRQSLRAVIPTIVSQVLNDERSVKLGSISPIRDMLYVKDTAMGFMLAGIKMAAVGEVISVGTGMGVTVGEIVNIVQEICGTHKNITEDHSRVRPPKSEVFKLVCNNAKALELLDWKPTYNLREGLTDVVQFLKERTDLIKNIKYTV